MPFVFILIAFLGALAGGVGACASYTALDAISQEKLTIDGRVYDFDYVYDANGSLEQRNGLGGSVYYMPDAFGRARRVTKPGVSDYITNVSYHANGLTALGDFANGKDFFQNLNDRQRPNSLAAYTPGGSYATLLTYDYDARGKVTSIIDGVVAGENRTFGYDPNGRLLTSTGPWGSGSYGYDALSNIRTRSEGTSGASTVAYASNNRVTSAVVNGASRTYAYDARGNTTSIGSSGFAYDFNNQPVTVTGTGAATFLYDGNLKRVKEVRAGKTIYTVYSRVTGGLIWKDEMTDGKTTAYVSAGQASVRFGYNNGTLATAEYIHADHLGSPIAATNAAGNVTWRESYRPFGKALRIFGSAPANDNSTGFTGHLEDDASGLVYMQARYYDPLVGRFLATDPIGYQDQLNLYAYVANDPVNNVDPTGEYIESLIDVAFIAADIADIATNGFNAANSASLVGNLAGLALPGATGVGLAARGAVEGAQAAAKAADKAGDAAKASKAANGLPKPPTGKGSVSPSARDPKRVFSKDDKAKAVEKQGGQCGNGCGKEVTKDDPGHHVERHADGGKTTQENLAVVCEDCHKDLHKSR